MSEPIRILQIVTQMNRAGLENRLMDIYRNIDKNTVQFDFYTCRKEKGYFDDEIVKLGGRVYYSQNLSFKNILGISRRFKEFLALHREYKIVHCHLNQWCGYILKGAKKACVPVRIAHSRTALETKSIKNIIKNVIKINVNKYATHRFAVSKKAGCWLYGKKMFDNGLVSIWPNAIDINKFEFSSHNRELYRKKLGLTGSHTYIHVGNIRPEKNHKFLIDLFKEIKDEQENSMLLIVGADYISGEIQRYTDKQNISKCVLFLGARSDIPELFHASDALIFPSLYEGFPGTVLEAQAAGLRCYISNTITKEVCITNLVTSLPLGNIQKWKDIIKISPKENKRDISKKLMESNYDIKKLTNELMTFYCSFY